MDHGAEVNKLEYSSGDPVTLLRDSYRVVIKTPLMLPRGSGAKQNFELPLNFVL